MSSPINTLPPSNVVRLDPKTVQTVPQEEVREDDFSFADILDVVNPLQHIPVLSSVYQQLTGDTIRSGPRLMGSAIYGAITGGFLPGVATAAINVILKENTGKDAGEYVTALFTPDQPASGTYLAVAPTVPEPDRDQEFEATPPPQEHHVYTGVAPSLSAPRPETDYEAMENWENDNIQLAIDRYQSTTKSSKERKSSLLVRG